MASSSRAGTVKMTTNGEKKTTTKQTTKVDRKFFSPKFQLDQSQDIIISDIFHFFCYSNFVLILDVCSSPYTKIGDLCIHVSSENEKKNYSDAKDYCHQINGRLYEPRNRTQYEVLGAYLKVITKLSHIKYLFVYIPIS